MASFEEWVRNNKKKEQPEQEPAAPSFENFVKEQRDANPLYQLSKEASILGSETERHYQNWQGGTLVPASRTAKTQALISKAEALRGSYADESIDSIIQYAKDLEAYAKGNQDYYSQWKSQEDYDAYQTAVKEREKLLSFDLTAGQTEMDNLKAVQKEYEDAKWIAQRAATQSEEYKAAEQKMAQIYQQYGDLNGTISQKNAYLTRAQRAQDGVRLTQDAMNAADFGQYNSFSGYEKKLIPDYKDVVYGIINNADTNLAVGQGWGRFSDTELSRLDATRYMTQEERQIYNYYYNKQGYEAAEAYLDSIEETINARHGEEMRKSLPDSALLKVAFGAPVGVDQANAGIQSFANGILGNDEYRAPSALQYAGQGVREDLDSAGFRLPEALGGVSIGQAAYDTVSTAANMTPSILTSVAIGTLNPAAGAYAGQALLGASAAGNAYQEKLNEGYTANQAKAYGLMIGASEIVMEKLLGGISKLGGGMLTDTAIDGLGKIDDVLAKAAKTTGGRILLNAGSEALEEGLQAVLEPYIWKAVSGEKIDVSMEEALYSALLGFVTGGLFEGVDAGTQAITNRIQSTKAPATPSAPQLTQNVQAETLKPASVAAGTSREAPDAVTAPQESKVTPTEETTPQTAPEVSADAAPITEVAVENGKLTLKTAEGDMDTSNAVYSSQEEALVYDAVEQVSDIIDTTTANKLSRHLLDLGEVNSDVYARAIAQAYTYGYAGYSRTAAANASLAYGLTEKQRNVAYGYGEQYRKAKAAADQAKVQAKSKPKTQTKGKVHFEGEAVTKRQRTSLKALEKVAEIMGVQIYVFESKVKDGKRVSINGSYDPNTGSIRIDLHAGQNGEGTMLFTAAHELTHMIQQWSPEKYRILSDFLMEQYGKKGVDVDALVKAQQEKAKCNGMSLTYDQAHAEVIADSMESMLADGKVLEKLVLLKQKDETLFDKIKKFISELAAKIRKVYEGLSPDSAEGRYVAEMKDAAERLQTMFAEALAEASENFRSATKSVSDGDMSNLALNQNVGVQYSLKGTNQDGIEVYETSDEIKKLPYKERQQRFLEIMANEYKGRTAKFIRNGHAYYATFDETDVNKNIYGDNRSDKKGWKAKINVGADGDIFELVENSQYDGSQQEKGKKITAHRGVGYWDYFIKNVQVDGTVFDLLANVRKKSDGAFVYSIQLNENKKIKASPPLGSLSRASNGVPNASANNIAQPAPKVNMHSDRDTESASNRSLLANAFESIAKDEMELKKLQEYQRNISEMDAQQQKLTELNAQIKELSFAKGKRDPEKIRALRDEAIKTTNRIQIYDSRLLRLEAAKPLQDVLSRERKRVAEKAKAKTAEAVKAEKQKAEVRQSEILRDFRETKAALQGAKSDTAIMEKEFLRITREYEKLAAKTATKAGRDAEAIGSLEDALREETKKHREDQKLWEAEFNRLVREYESAGRSIAKLEQKIDQQRAMAARKVEDRKKSAVRQKIKAFKEKLEGSLLKPSDRRYVPAGLVNAMVEVCNLIDTDTDLYKKDGSINKAQEHRDQTKLKLLELKNEYEKLKTQDDGYGGEFDEIINNYLEELVSKFENRSLSEMTLDELNEMYEILRSVDETLQDARKLIGWGDAMDVYEAGDAIVAEQAAISKTLKNGKRNAAQVARDSMLNYSLSPVRNVERMSGYLQDSALLKLFKKLEQGVRKKNKFVMDAYKAFESLTSGKEYDDAVYKEFGKQYMDVKGRTFRVSKMQMMQAILSYEREQANGMRHVSESGFTFADLKTLQKGKLADAVSEEHAHRVPAAAAMAEEFREALRNDPWCQKYMAQARKFFNETAKDAINETMMTLKHRIVAKDKAYIPFEVDKNFVVREISAENNLQQTINSYGMLKEVKKGAPQPLIITGLNNIIDRHIDMVGNVYGLAVEIRNFNKVWNMRPEDNPRADPTVKASIDGNWGKGGVKSIEQTVKDIQGPRVKERSALYSKVKSGYIGATFALNLSVVTKQIGSLFSATSMLRWRDPFRMIGNLVYTMANSKKIAAEVDQYTASAWMRRQGLSDAELHTLMTEAKKPGLLKKLNKAPAIINPAKWITAMDSAVALSLWKYAKQDTAKRTGLKGEGLLKAAAEFYDEVIENTQSVTDVLHRPEVQKKGDPLSEALGMFKTDLYQMAGQLEVSAGRFTANRSKANAAALGGTLVSILGSAVWGQLMTTVFALLRYKVNQYRDEDDKDLTWESWLKRQGFAFGGDVFGYFLPIFGSEVVGIIENMAYRESEDYLDNISFTAVNDLIDTIVTIGGAVADGEMPKPEQWQKILTKTLQVFGVPASNILRTWEAIRLHAKDIANGEFFSFEAGAQRTAANHAHRIAEAIEDGRMNVAEGLLEDAFETGKSASDIKSALGQKYRDGSFTKNTVTKFLEMLGLPEEDIYWTFDSWDYEGGEDYAKYGDFYTAVQSGKNLKAEIKRYTDNGVSEETLRNQITSHFKPIYTGMSTKDRAALKGYLINGYTYCGMDRADAEAKLLYWDFLAENPETTLSQYQVADYYEFAKPARISASVYEEYVHGVKDITGEGKKEKRMKVIDSLPLTKAQKDALYYAEGWSEKTIGEAPWH